MHAVVNQAVRRQAQLCLLDQVIVSSRHSDVFDAAASPVCCWGKNQTALSEVKPVRCMQGISIEDKSHLKVGAYLGALLGEVCMKFELCLAAAQLLPDSGPMAARSC